MDNSKLNDEIIEFLKESSSPMTITSIAEKFRISEYRTIRALDELKIGNLILEIIPENKANGRKYYTTKEHLNNSNGNEKDFSQIIVQETVNVKDNYKDLSEKIEKIDGNVNGIYANIISIMSIFVSVFALITVNANIVFDLTINDLSNVLGGIIIVNFFVVACIFALLFGVKKIIIDSISGKKK